MYFFFLYPSVPVPPWWSRLETEPLAARTHTRGWIMARQRSSVSDAKTSLHVNSLVARANRTRRPYLQPQAVHPQTNSSWFFLLFLTNRTTNEYHKFNIACDTIIKPRVSGMEYHKSNIVCDRNHKVVFILSLTFAAVKHYKHIGLGLVVVSLHLLSNHKNIKTTDIFSFFLSGHHYEP